MENNTPEQKTQKDIFDLSEQEFEHYFKAEILPQIQNTKRNSSYKHTLKVFIGSIIFTFLVAIPIFKSISAYYFLNSQDQISNVEFIFCVLLDLFYLIFLIFFIAKLVQFVHKKTNKDKIKKDILNKLGLTYIDFEPDSEASHFLLDPYNRILKETFFGVGKTPPIDDIIRGSYRGNAFIIMDIFDISDSKYPHKIFLSIKINKKFKEDLKLISKRYSLITGLNNIFSANEIVNLEDISFSKEFQIFSKDQVEARYLLTTGFIDRLLKYKQAKKCDMEILFSNKNLEFGNLFFCIYSSKDMFEFPSGNLKYNTKKIKTIYNIILEIKEILLIVDALKLDQDIGM